MDKLEISIGDGEVTFKPYGILFSPDVDLIEAMTYSMLNKVSITDAYKELGFELPDKREVSD